MGEFSVSSKALKEKVFPSKNVYGYSHHVFRIFLVTL